MASNAEAQDNPVQMNVVPMVDVIFCRRVFCMCSFAFKAREGRFEAWLPKDLGWPAAPAQSEREIRVVLSFDPQSGTLTRQFGERLVKGEVELEHLIEAAREDGLNSGQARVSLSLEADAQAPRAEVVLVVNLAHRLGIADIRFCPGVSQAATR